MERANLIIQANKAASANAWIKTNFDKAGGDWFDVPRWKKNKNPDTDPPDYFVCSAGGLTPTVIAMVLNEFKQAKYSCEAKDDKNEKFSAMEVRLDIKPKGGGTKIGKGVNG